MSTTPHVGTRAVTEAEAALALAELEPRAGRAAATSVLAQPDVDGWPEAVSVAERALGLSLLELHDIRAATAHLRRSVELALAAELPRRAAEARCELSRALLLGGDTEPALEQAEKATTGLQGARRARLVGRRAWMLQRLGRLQAAVEQYGAPLEALRREGDVAGRAELLHHRGRAHACLGSFGPAEDDLNEALDLFTQARAPVGAALVTHELGFASARRGDVGTALEHYDRAAEALATLGVPGAPGLLDRCEALLSARLVAEARHTAEIAAAELEANGMELDLAEARLMLGQTALLAGAHDEARHHATLAWRAFTRQSRPAWAALARYASLRAAWMGGHRSPVALRAATDTAAELEVTGLASRAQHARLLAGLIALAVGDAEEAGVQLRSVAEGRRSGPADTRARAWHAEALLRHAGGDGDGAEEALRAGMGAVARHRDELGATDRRALAAGEGQELADLGTRIALESRSAERVLAWSERRTAAASLVRRRAPHPDPELADQLAQLRHLVNEVERLAATGDDARPLFHRQAMLEKAISARIGLARAHADAEQPDVAAGGVTPEELAHALGTSALVELVESSGHLHAVTVVEGRAHLHQLGDVAEVRAEVAALRFALTRLARGRGSSGSRAAAVSALRYTSDRLDEVLLRPLAHLLGDRALVLVPTVDLHALPWSTLRSCRSRPVSVCASAALWSRSVARTSPPSTPRDRPAPEGVVLVAGPGPVHADAEVRKVAAHYPEATTLVGPTASPARVTDALDGAAMAHVVAEGSVRADNPLFSSLRLSGGPVTMFDLEQVARLPQRIVLSGCDGGLSALHPGQGISGLTAALLSMGTATLVASVIPVSAPAASELMDHFHRRLAAGVGPAAALAGARDDVDGAGGEALARTAGFVCFGAG